MYRTPKTLTALAAAVALFSAACATQPPTGATTGAPERPGITPTAAAAPAPTRPAATATTAAPTTPGTATTPPTGSPTAPTSPPAGSPTAPVASPTTASGGGTSGTNVGDPAKGRSKFTGDAGCSACHGDKAQGGVFPGALKLSGTALSLDEVKTQIRSPRDPSKGMPPFSPAQLSDQDIANIYAWLKTNP